MKGLLYKLYGVFVICSIGLLGLLLYGANTVRTQKPIQEEITRDAVATPTPTLTTQEVTPSETVKSVEEAKVIPPPPAVKKETALVVKKEVQVVEHPQTNIDIVDTTEYVTYKNPCTQVVTYSLGTFDTRFNITQNDFLRTINSAVSMWNEAGGRTFFAYTPTGGDIKVSLIYDERQQRTDESALQKAEIENSKQAADALKQEYEAMKVTFNDKKSVYTGEVDAFTTRQKTYNDTVAMWNTKGGAPQPDYNNLIEERDYLNRESTRLKVVYDELQSLLTTINQKIDRYNELVRYVNEKIAQVNTLANKQFTEGYYSGAKNEISVFQYSDTIKLERVLTHEFGHALGLDHVNTEDSIMYYLNTKNTLTLSQDDIQALKSTCKLP